MLQQLLAIIIILFFLSRLLIQKKKNQVGANEFFFWLVFWVLALLAIISLKWLDKFVAELGFSGSGIQVLFYLAVISLFYFIFRLRIRLEKIERDITKIVRKIAVEETDNEKKYL